MSRSRRGRRGRRGATPVPAAGASPFLSPKEAIAYICPVCFWENDVFDPDEDAPSDENRGMTLRQGRENYRKWGAVREDLVRHARPPARRTAPVNP
ncbi:MAG: CPCC family cysteine-rich protein [Flavonifractor plautii]